MDNNRYIIFFILGLTSVVAILLSFLREATKEKAALNEDIFNKRAILSAIEDNLDKEVADFTDAEVVEIFATRFEQVVLDMEGNVIEGVMAEEIDLSKEKKKPEAERRYPLYVYENDGTVNYILSVRGSGLWDEIWGNIALADDLNTVVGAAFDHKGETPGLGAEIKDNPSFAANFKGKEILNDQGEFVSIEVRKGGAEPGNPHQVDGISGATVTANGVTDMLYKGIQSYQPYLEELRPAAQQQGMLIQE